MDTEFAAATGLGSCSDFPISSARLDALGVNYRIPEPAGLEEDRLTLSDRLVVELGNPVSAGELRYTLDGSDPEPESRSYRKPLNLKLDEEGTTVSARVYLPGGKGGAIARARFARTSLRPAQDIQGLRLDPGLEFAYAEGSFESAREVSDVPATRRGRTPRVQLTGEERLERFGLRLDGYLHVPEDDVCKFEIRYRMTDRNYIYMKNL